MEVHPYVMVNIQCLGGGFLYFFYVHPILGEMIQFDEYFSNGLNPPTRSEFTRGSGEVEFEFSQCPGVEV